MIRINLLGQIRPKATKQSVPLESTLQILLGVAALAIALIVLSVTYYSQKRQLDDTNARIAALKAERTNLQQIKQEVDRFETQKAARQTQIGVIQGVETYRRHRSPPKKSHRRAGITPNGRQYGRPCRSALAHFPGSHRRQPPSHGRSWQRRFHRELHDSDEALRLLRQNRD